MKKISMIQMLFIAVLWAVVPATAYCNDQAADRTGQSGMFADQQRMMQLGQNGGMQSTPQPATQGAVQADTKDTKEGLHVGQKAPHFSLIDTNNISWISKNFFNNDRLVIFYFFDIESEACREELKFLSKMNREHTDDVEILAITSNSSDNLTQFIRQEKVNLTILIDKDREVSSLYHAISVFPTTFFINDQGDIIEVSVGSAGDTEAIMATLLKSGDSQGKAKERFPAATVQNAALPPAPVPQPPAQKESGIARQAPNERVVLLQRRQPEIPEEIQKNIKGLQASSFERKRDAAKRIFRDRLNHPALFKALVAELKKGYKLDSRDRVHADAMSWLCKALAISHNPEAVAVLTEVEQHSPNKKIQKYARKSIELYNSLR